MTEKHQDHKQGKGRSKKRLQRFPGVQGPEIKERPPRDTDKPSRSQQDSKSQPGNQPHMNIKGY